MPQLDVYNDNGYGNAFYNVSGAVGVGSRNRFEDVMLVQFFLKRFYLKLLKPPKGQIMVDGVCGPVTLSWIREFQLHFKSTTLVNGIVESAKTETSFSSASHTIYTIITLNKFLYLVDETWYLSLPMDPTAPAPLRPLFINGTV